MQVDFNIDKEQLGDTIGALEVAINKCIAINDDMRHVVYPLQDLLKILLKIYEK